MFQCDTVILNFMSFQLQAVDLQAVTRTTRSTQFYILNLFADYIVPFNSGWAWTNDLLYLLKQLGVSDRAGRTTLSRMTKQGWFKTERSGRRSRYLLTPVGRAIIDEGDKRVFEEALTHWDGTWYTLVYSLPEEKRQLRNELRKKLIWFGFGCLAPGTWISPHNRRQELELIVGELDVRPYVSLFASRNLEMVSNADLVERCWDLGELQEDYAAFVKRWGPEVEKPSAHAHLEKGTTGASRQAEERFIKRFQLTFDFQPFPRKDPNLPLDLLPPAWQGHEARRIFQELRTIYNEGLPAFMTGILS